MKKLSAIKILIFMTVVAVMGILYYPAMVWMEWMREQRAMSALLDAYPDSRFWTDSSYSSYDPFTIHHVHPMYSEIADRIPDWLHGFLERTTAVAIVGEEAVSSVAMRQVSSMTYLEEISIKGGTAGADLSLFQKHVRLSALSLSGADVDDADLQHLACHTNLVVLILSGTPVTDGGLGVISELPKLQELDLSGTRVSDKGLPLLAGLQNLKTLNLAGTEISDKSLPSFSESLNLKNLGVGDTQITAEGLLSLNKILSGNKSWQTDIWVPPGTHDLEITMTSDQFFESDLKEMKKQGMVTLIRPFPVDIFDSDWDPED